ncbi:MAG: MFS transporter, partial [Solirubrobacteraceae bacterium]
MSTFFGVASGLVPVFTIVYALSNLAGPLSIGRLFDTVGRKPMIAGTYIGSAAISVLLAILFVQHGLLGPWTFIVVVMGAFFLASSGASAAYLTASEIFPMETRALAIAFFFAIGTGVGGIIGPLLFGNLIGTKNRTLVAIAFLIGAAVMAIGGIIEILFGVRAEGEQLEDIAQPLTAGEGFGAEGNGLAAGAVRDQTAASRARAQASQERARAAEHRAMQHELAGAAHSGGSEADGRVEEEGILAQVAELRARAFDERAAAHEKLAVAVAEPALSVAASARESSAAAHERAVALERQAAALTAEHERAAGRFLELAAAATERARAREQLALAEQSRTHAAPGDGDGDRGGGPYR